MTYTIVQRAGRFAIIRVLAGGDAAGYDLEAHRAGEQRHFRIHRDRPAVCTAIDAAFEDSRKYPSLEAAAEAAAGLGRGYVLGCSATEARA